MPTCDINVSVPPRHAKVNGKPSFRDGRNERLTMLFVLLFSRLTDFRSASSLAIEQSIIYVTYRTCTRMCLPKWQMSWNCFTWYKDRRYAPPAPGVCSLLRKRSYKWIPPKFCGKCLPRISFVVLSLRGLFGLGDVSLLSSARALVFFFAPLPPFSRSPLRSPPNLDSPSPLAAAATRNRNCLPPHLPSPFSFSLRSPSRQSPPHLVEPERSTCEQPKLPSSNSSFRGPLPPVEEGLPTCRTCRPFLYCRLCRFWTLLSSV